MLMMRTSRLPLLEGSAVETSCSLSSCLCKKADRRSTYSFLNVLCQYCAPLPYHHGHRLCTKHGRRFLCILDVPSPSCIDLCINVLRNLYGAIEPKHGIIMWPITRSASSQLPVLLKLWSALASQSNVPRILTSPLHCNV